MGIYRALPSKKDGSTTGVFNTVLLANNVKELGKQASMPPLTGSFVCYVRSMPP